MERSYEWVEAKPPGPEHSRGTPRAARLFAGVVVGAILGATPLAWLNFGPLSFQRLRDRQQRQEKGYEMDEKRRIETDREVEHRKYARPQAEP